MTGWVTRISYDLLDSLKILQIILKILKKFTGV